MSNSLKKLCDYMMIDTRFCFSSQLNKNNALKREQRIININQVMGADHFINAIGGTELYSKEEFARRGIQMNFLKCREVEYRQFDNKFIPSLSIIDVLMFNPLTRVKEFLEEYDLV